MSGTIVSQVRWTDNQKDDLIELLGTLMSECSEECWSAGWLLNTEKQIPPLVDQILNSRQPAKWGHGIIDYETAISLKGLATILGSWVIYDEESDKYSSC